MGKIKKILENELVGGTQTTDVYPVTSIKAVYDESNERLDNIIRRKGIVNISTNYNSSHIAEVFTLVTAIAKVPSEDRVLGFQGKYLAFDGWHTIIYTGDSLTDWGDTTKWTDLADKIFNSISKNATFAGMATPNISPGTPDGPVFWIASEPGVYVNFGNTEIDSTGIFTWDGTSWSFEKLDFGGGSNIEIVDNLEDGGHDSALSAEMGKILGQRSEYPMEMVHPSESGAISTNGLNWSIGGWWRTPYTKIDPTKPIYAKGDSNNASVSFVAFYDDNLVCKGTVSKLGAAGVEYEVQVPDGATCARVVCTTAQKETSYLTQKVQRNLNDVVVEHDETLNSEINLIDLVNRFTPGYLELNTGVQIDHLYITSDYIFLDDSLDITLLMDTRYDAPMDVISFYSDKKDTTYLGGLHHLVNNTYEKHFHKLDIPQGAKWMRVCGPDEAKIRAIKLMVNQRDYATSHVDALANANDYNPARFLLPTNIDVVVGRQCDFFVQDTIYNLNKLPYVYSLPSSITDYGKGHLRINASSAGTEQITLKTYKQDRYINDYLVGTQTINVRKVAKSGMSGTFNVLIVGDSLVQYGPNPSETYRLLNEDGDVTINQIGLQSQSLDGVTYHHEGHGGWTWSRFNSGSDSPFVFNGELSFAQYMATNFPTLSGIDFCVVMLGTNDSEGYTLPGAKTFVDALLADYPNCKIAIGILAYGRPCDGMPTDMERKLRIANVEYLDTFDNGKYHANVTCIGQGCWIDRVNDYQHEEADSTPYSSDKFIRYTDGVHPKTQGYKQWGRAVYCKIRSWVDGNL